MSFLNSVLSSIGGNGAQTLTPPPQVVRPQNTAVGQPVSRNQPSLAPAVTGALQNNKRKRVDSRPEPNAKHLKNSIAVEQDPWAAVQPNPPNAKPAASLEIIPNAAPKSAIPYRGTSRPNPAPGAFIPPVSDIAKAPKKGSYAEIMARAKAAESKAKAVGVIHHKPKDKMPISYKKEMKMQKKAVMNKKLGIKDDEKRPSSSGSMSSSPAPGPTEGKKLPQPTYKGTAKSASDVKPAKPQPTYKGTIMPGASANQRQNISDRDGRPSKPHYDEYAATDEDDLDDVEEDEYGSGESDEMEAGFSDVEQEETIATRTARKEDEEEARLEAQLKREKEERKKRLEALSKKAKPPRY